MEEDDGGASTPFWLQSRRNNTYFRRTSSLGNRATSVAIQSFFAGVAAFLIVFFIIPPFFSSVSQFLRPHLVRKSWDYLNFVLVLFAVICGFLSRNAGNNDESKEEVTKRNDVINGYSFDKFPSSPSIIDRGRSVVSTPRYWIDDRGGGDQFQDQTVYKRFSRLRSVSSYPDLRNREFETDGRWRFYDDTRVSECRYEAIDPIYQNQDPADGGGEKLHNDDTRVSECRYQAIDPIYQNQDPADGGGEKLHNDGSVTEKVDVVETATAEVVEETSNPAPPPSPPPPPPPTSKPAKRRTKRVYHDVGPKEEEKEERADFLAPRPPSTTTVYEKNSKQEKKKKKGGATKEFLIALRRKKKKQRQQSIDGLDLLFGSDSQFDYSMPPQNLPPHPPPPPPPPPFFQGLFSSKKGKSKRTYSDPPPPPPPPPPHRSFQSRAKANPPAEVTRFTGSESPLMPIPPPPPPPPFKMPAWKFVKRGDYVRMASNISISSDEPDDDQDVLAQTGKSMFCPSPDVDTKAEDFIARIRAGLKLEKMNSVKRGRSNLGPGPDESKS